MPTERVPQIPDDVPTPRVDFIAVATEGWAYTGSLVLDERGRTRIAAGGVEKDVSLVETDQLLGQIDRAYRAKFGRRYPTTSPRSLLPPTRRDARARTARMPP